MKIFRKLFKTEPYRVLQDRLKEERNACETEFKRLQGSIRQYIGGIEIDKDSPLSVRGAAVIKGDVPLQETIAFIKEVIDEDDDAKASAEEKKAFIDEKLEKVNAVIRTCEDAAGLEKSIADDQKSLVENGAKLEEAEGKLTAAEEASKGAGALIERAAALEGRLSDYDALADIKKNIQGQQNELAKLEQSVSETDGKLQKTEQALTADKAALKELQAAGVNLVQLQAALEKLQSRKQELEGLLDDLEDLETLQTVYDTKRNTYEKKANESNAAQEKYLSMNRAFLDEQAGVLAKELRDGEPCPVCGSTEHPMIAPVSEGAPSREDVDQARKTADKLSSEAEAASRDAAAAKVRAEEKEQAVAEMGIRMLGEEAVIKEEPFTGQSADGINTRNVAAAFDRTALDDAVNEALHKNKSESKELQAKISDEETRITKKEQLETSIPEQEKAATELRDTLSSLKQKQASTGSELELLQGNQQRMEECLDFSNKAEAQQEITSLRNQAKALQQAVTDAAADVNSRKQEQAALSGKIEVASKQLAALELGDAEQIAIRAKEAGDEKQQLLQEKAENDTKLEIVGFRVRSNQKNLEEIEKAFADQQETEQRYRWVSSLADAANGKLSGKDKLMLETFVQMQYFDRVLENANTRLLKMTAGRYRLKRREDASNQKKQTGLDLNVIDYYNGSERDVKTLSGGESFDASLALALGLSDEVQARAGGIQLDTMFVDEGFGSLDEEALSRAMNALLALSESGRLIGIISHVREMKDKIDRQIVITKSIDGTSRVEVR